MSAAPPTIEWFIARDGVQHGPISDVELMKFVEFGHLRPTDLVWCQRFTEWQPGSVVFPAQTLPKPPAPPTAVPRPAPAPQPAQPAPAPAQPAPVVSASQQSAVAQQAPAPATRPAPGPAANAEPATAQPQPQPAPTQAPAPHRPTQEELAWAEAMRAVAQGRAGGGAASAQPSHAEPRAPAPTFTPATSIAPAPAPSPAPVHLPEMARPAYPGYAPQPELDPQPGSQLSRIGLDDAEFDDPPRRRGWIGRLSIAVAVLLIIGGLGWLGWQNRNLITGAAAIPGMLASKVSSTPSPDLFRTTPYDAPGETRDLIDTSLQRTAIWRLLKKEYADWYGERLADIERMRTQKQDEKAISKFLADVIVTLRRKNAQAALQSSPDHLRQMASMFVGNLKQLSSRDGQTCFGFISFGESHPFMQELSRTPAFAESQQRQMMAVFEAIVDGRTHRRIHPNARRGDYDTLTKELTGRGWSQTDLATFSDPQKLSASPPEKVCTLVQEWFTTQLSLKDAELQTRLLAESLKPLVGG